MNFLIPNFAPFNPSLSPEAGANIKPFLHYQNSFMKKNEIIFKGNLKDIKTNTFRQINYSLLNKIVWVRRLSRSCIGNRLRNQVPFLVALITDRQKHVVGCLRSNSLL